MIRTSGSARLAKASSEIGERRPDACPVRYRFGAVRVVSENVTGDGDALGERIDRRFFAVAVVVKVVHDGVG